MGQTDPPAPARTLFGHPPGLYVLFLTQMWERFSYFGMLALLIIYLNQFLRLSQGDASSVFKWYTTAIYFTPLIGGYLADRFLGNKRAIVIGAVLMAVGHFLMAFPSLPMLYGALIFLVVGCGLLTPPLTTQVGLLYPPNDARRDSAYTIFYVGINFGAFLSPFVCGWLVENTRGRFHAGFTVAGIGMVIALITYVLGQRWIVEVDQGNATATDAGATTTSVEDAPSVLPLLNRVAPSILVALGCIIAGAAPVMWFLGTISVDTLLSLNLTSICVLLFGWVASRVHGALRDRVLAILLLAAFSVFYWAGAGQYGNAINLWAEQNTDRYVSSTAPAPELFPPATPLPDAAGDEVSPLTLTERFATMFQPLPAKQGAAETSWHDSLNPVPTAWFQSINPLLILVLAPLFAMLWTALERRQLNPSIPVKMALGLLLMALAFGVMVIASKREAATTSVPLALGKPPAPLVVNDQGQLCRPGPGGVLEPYAGGRLQVNNLTTIPRLNMDGVLTDLMRDDIVQDTAPADFVASLQELQAKSAGGKAQVELTRVPPGFDLRYAGFGQATGNAEVRFDPMTRTLTATIPLEDKEIKGLKVAAGDPTLRATLDDLMRKSSASRVSPWWLGGFFLLATLGELCISPVGLSMVSQLAPARFATMLMGVWLLNYSFGNFAAGAFGEQWGTWPPQTYFFIVFVVLAVATVLMFVCVPPLRRLMHGSDMPAFPVQEGYIPFKGHKIWYRIVGTGEVPGKLPVLCLHGGPGASHHYLKPLEALAATGRRVIFYDQLGGGNSDQPHDPALWTVGLFVEEVAAVRRALGLERVHLFGQSWGGMLGMEYALTQPAGLASLTVASSPASMIQWVAEANRLRAELPADVQQTLLQHEAAGTTQSPEYQQAMMVFYRRHLCRLDPWPAELQQSFAAMMKNPEVYHTMNGPSEFHVIGTLRDWDITSRLGEIRVPTLVAAGRYDEATPEIAATVQRGIPGAELVLFEQSSHSAHLEQPDDFRKMLTRFLDRVEART